MTVAPRHTLLLDAAVLIALLFVRPRLREEPETRRQAILALAWTGLTAAGVLLTFGGATMWVVESTAAPLLARARGERIVIEPAFVDLGERQGALQGRGDRRGPRGREGAGRRERGRRVLIPILMLMARLPGSRGY